MRSENKKVKISNKDISSVILILSNLNKVISNTQQMRLLGLAIIVIPVPHFLSKRAIPS